MIIIIIFKGNVNFFVCELEIAKTLTLIMSLFKKERIRNVLKIWFWAIFLVLFCFVFLYSVNSQQRIWVKLDLIHFAILKVSVYQPLAVIKRPVP